MTIGGGGDKPNTRCTVAQAAKRTTKNTEQRDARIKNLEVILENERAKTQQLQRIAELQKQLGEARATNKATMAELGLKPRPKPKKEAKDKPKKEAKDESKKEAKDESKKEAQGARSKQVGEAYTKNCTIPTDLTEDDLREAVKLAQAEGKSAAEALKLKQREASSDYAPKGKDWLKDIGVAFVWGLNVNLKSLDDEAFAKVLTEAANRNAQLEGILSTKQE